MPKTRLTKSGRQMLRGLARRLVAAPAERAARDEAYKRAHGLVTALIVERYPPADMAILARYDTARHDNCIRLQCSPGGMLMFECDRGDKLPLQPNNRGYGCNTFLANPEASEAMCVLDLTDKNLKRALDDRMQKYISLIEASRCYEDVVEVWPEAEELRTRLGAGAIVVALDAGIISAIRAEVAERAQVAA